MAALPPIKFVQAKNWREKRTKAIRLVVIHTMEYPERPTGAEWCADYFAGPNAPMASPHYSVDNDSIVQSVREDSVAFTAGGSNSSGTNDDGIHLEHAGYSAQGHDGWADPYSIQMLDLSARLSADIAVRRSIPIRRLTTAQLRAGEAGFIGHVDSSAVYGGTHTDPGPTFPWEAYLALVRHYADSTEDTSMARTSAFGLTLDAQSAKMLRAGVDLIKRENPKLGAKLWGIPGFGSYVSNAASGGIDGGGGHADLNAENLTDAEAKYVAKTLRRVGIVASFRERAWYSQAAGYTIRPGWQRHIHCTFKGIPDATWANTNQTDQIVRLGRDGLARKSGGYDTDRDARDWIGMTFASFLSLTQIVAQVGGTVVVRLLQKAVRAYEDGVWGDETDRDLVNTRATAINAAYFSDPRWSLGVRRRMQRSWGAFEDGAWGPATASSLASTVKAIQSALGTAVDGAWGPQTDTAFLNLRAKHYSGKGFLAGGPALAKPAPVAKKIDSTRPWGPYPWPAPSSYYGPSKAGTAWYSGKVASKTRSLASIRLAIKMIQKGVGAPIDGSYGAQTVKSVQAWQKAHGLPADGITGPSTWAAIAKSLGQ